MTGREWFEQMPEPYRSLALKYSDSYSLDDEYNKCSSAIYCAFSWAETPEGSHYWMTFFKQLIFNFL